MEICYFADIDECETRYEECGAHGICVNTVGSYYCVCKKGFAARGVECEGKLLKAWVNVNLSEILRGLKKGQKKGIFFGTPPSS